MGFVWTCLKCGRKVMNFRNTNLRCCSERMTNGTRPSNKKQEYYRYIKSPDWKNKADEAKRRAGNRCQICNQSGKTATLNAHHRTYARLGNERPDDITVLCEGCHDTFHKSGKLAELA